MPRKFISKRVSKKLVTTLSILTLLLVLGFFFLLLWPWRGAVTNADIRKEFQLWMQSLGFDGWCLFIALQMTQVIVAVIPGEPFEMLAGILYGSLGGLVSSLFGTLLGSSIVFMLVRRFGYPLVTSFFPEEKIRSLPILNRPERLERLILLLFLIPGTPKDILTYAVGLTNIEMKRFLALSTFARIPSVITSVWVGSSIREGDWLISLIIFGITAAVGLLGIWIHKIKFTDKNQKL